jgi:hypothetical protein
MCLALILKSNTFLKSDIINLRKAKIYLIAIFEIFIFSFSLVLIF